MSVKRVFVSDIHISTGLSCGTDGCYDWLCPKTPQKFCNFLKDKCSDNTVTEVIILGDLMDDWVYPIDHQPPKYDKIAAAPEIPQLMKALRNLAEEKKVTYVMGNHDMTLGEPQFANFKNAAFAGINFADSYETNDGLHAEHGHAYTMYNAVDPRHELPIGHYISRLAATVAEKQKHNYIAADLEMRFHSAWNDIREVAGLIRDPLVNMPLDYLVGQLDNVNDDTPITTVNGGVITIGQVRQQYARVGIEWEKKHGQLGGIRSAWREAVGLDGVADAIAKGEVFDGKSFKVVIFGHTHNKENRYLRPVDPGVPSIPTEEPYAVYANCGAWCLNKPLTYVTDEYDGDTHTVTLSFWDKSAPDVQLKI